MAGLDFAGMAAIYTHHRRVQIRPLVPDKSKSLNMVDDDNLIIHGDNLYALKALLPRYAGRIDCIYIDPPYNTGNEGWVYNDNVNGPEMKRWLENAREVDGVDLERHDKWMCMMWPRLQLLKELLAEDGVIFVSIDDNEQHRLRMMMDEIFGADNFVSNIIWHKKFSPQNDARHFSDDHDYILVYAKDAETWRPNLLPRTEKQDSRFSNPDNDPRGKWMASDFGVKTYQKEYDYPITTPSGRVVKPPASRVWCCSRESFAELVADNRIWFGKNGNGVPRAKRFLSEVRQGMTPRTVWSHEDVGHTQGATQELKRMGISFPNPKPHTLIERVLRIGADKNAIVLDSFAGSGTTAHAVLALNRQDGGNRKFILVECEDKYVDTTTAERVRCVIRGVPDAKSESTKDTITCLCCGRTDTNTSKNESLREGTGGSFTFCTLGEPLDINKMLAGESLPDYSTLAAHLFRTDTGMSVSKKLEPKNEDGLFHSANGTDYYLLYEPDLSYLRSDKSVLTDDRARRIGSVGNKAVVFGSGKHVTQHNLARMGIEFCLIPDRIRQA